MPAERMAEILRAIGRCWSHAKISAVYSEKWQVSSRTIERYVKRAYQELRVDDEAFKSDRRNRLRLAVEEHYSHAMKAGELGTAGLDLDRLAKIDGCYIDRIELQGPGGTPLQVSMSSALDDLARAIGAARRAPDALPEMVEVEEVE